MQVGDEVGQTDIVAVAVEHGIDEDGPQRGEQEGAQSRQDDPQHEPGDQAVAVQPLHEAGGRLSG